MKSLNDYNIQTSINKFTIKVFIIFCVFIFTFILTGCDNDTIYTVTFDTGSEVQIESQQVKHGDKVKLDIIPSKDGYVFTGWLPNINQSIKQDTNFVAQYEVINYNIIYHIDNDTTNDNPKTITYDESITLNDASKGGYIFEGWYLDEELTRRVITIRRGTTEDVDVYPKFEEVTYKIYYHLDGGLNDYRNPTEYRYSDDSSITLLPATKEDYAFVGWYKEESFVNLITTIDPKSETNFELFARFTKDTLATSKVRFNLNGGTADINNHFDYSKKVYQAEATMYNQYDLSYGRYVTVANKTGPKSNYYIQIKKIDVQDMYKIVYIGQGTTNLLSEGFDLYISWPSTVEDEENRNTLMQVFNSKDALTNAWVELIDIPDHTSTTCDIDLIFYSISAYDDSGYLQYKQPEILPIPTREGYNFLGWFSSLDGTVQTTYPGYYETKRITYTAEWIETNLAGSVIETTTLELNQKIATLSNSTDDITLPTTLNGCSIEWSSDDITFSEGTTLNRIYTTKEVTIIANIKYENNTNTVPYTFTLQGRFKDLSNGVKAGYFYYNNGSASDYTFRNLDIMFMAFGYPTEDGRINNSVSLGNAIQSNFVTKAHENGVRVILSINTQNCSKIAASATLTENFANACLDFVQKYNIDGIDLDWEWPSTSEVANFTKLVKAIYEKIKANNPNHLITAAVGSAQHARYDLKHSEPYLDYISIMSYDMQVNSKANFHNALYYSSGKTYIAIENSYQNYTQYVDSHKIIIGIPFYARYWTNSSGLNTAAEYGGAISYGSLYSRYILPHPENEHFDEKCQVPYYYDPSTGFFASYDNPTSIKIKAKYVYDKGLAGLMYWQDGQDSSDKLVTAIVEGIKENFG